MTAHTPDLSALTEVPNLNGVTDSEVDVSDWWADVCDDGSVCMLHFEHDWAKGMNERHECEDIRVPHVSGISLDTDHGTRFFKGRDAAVLLLGKEAVDRVEDAHTETVMEAA